MCVWQLLHVVTWAVALSLPTLSHGHCAGDVGAWPMWTRKARDGAEAGFQRGDRISTEILPLNAIDGHFKLSKLISSICALQNRVMSQKWQHELHTSHNEIRLFYLSVQICAKINVSVIQVRILQTRHFLPKEFWIHFGVTTNKRGYGESLWVRKGEATAPPEVLSYVQRIFSMRQA